MERKPLIGVTPALNEEETRISVNRNFQEVLLAAGAVPVLLPITTDEDAMREMIRRCDGILFTGGGDIDPRRYGQQTRPCCGGITPDRDAFELPLAAMLHACHDKPVMGICRGAQVLNVALGGTMLQDVETDFGKPVLAHRQKQLARYDSHGAEIVPDSLLRRIVGMDALQINSLHHQAVSVPAEGLTVSARATDGVIEAVESSTHPFYLGLQWHPEIMWRTDEISFRLFKCFAMACAGTGW